MYVGHDSGRWISDGLFLSVDNGKFVLSEDWIRNVKNNGIIHSGRIYSIKSLMQEKKLQLPLMCII